METTHRTVENRTGFDAPQLDKSGAGGRGEGEVYVSVLSIHGMGTERFEA